MRLLTLDALTMMMPLFLFGLDTLLGSGVAEIHETAGLVTVRSSTIGMVWIFLGLGLCLFVGIGVDVWRRGRKALSPALASLGLLGTCIAIMIGVIQQNIMLTLDEGPGVITVERSGALGPLWVSRDVISLTDLRDIGIGHATIRSATRNGTPIGSDKDGYYLLVRTREGARIKASLTSASGTAPAAKAATALLRRINAHPMRAGDPVGSNLHRYGYPPS